MIFIPFSSSVSCILIHILPVDSSTAVHSIMRRALDKGGDSPVVIAKEEFSNNIPSFVLQSCSAFLLSYAYPKIIHFFNPSILLQLLAIHLSQALRQPLGHGPVIPSLFFYLLEYVHFGPNQQYYISTS
jgi:hypothetical protein